MNRTKPIASLSLDLDDKWTYLKTRGENAWTGFPSYLDVLVPRVVDFLAARNLRITIFVVGQDAALSHNRRLLRALADGGHEIGNHSFRHEPWMHLSSAAEVEREIRTAEEHIERATGRKPVGYRGPGFSLPSSALEVLARRGYLYDASTFPTYLVPLARAWYFMTTKLTAEEKRLRKSMGGTLRSGLRPIDPYFWRTGAAPLLEIPVTTMPWFRTPIHASYLMCLAAISPLLARRYFEIALWACRWTGAAPSILLHPTDFLGCDDTRDLAFFPGMNLSSALKLALLRQFVERLSSCFEVVPLEQHAHTLIRTGGLPITRLPRQDGSAFDVATDSDATQPAPRAYAA